MTNNEFITFTDNHLTGLENSLIYENYAEARSLFITATELFKIDTKSPADLCIADLFMIMTRIKSPSAFLNVFVDYILDYANTFESDKAKKITMNNLARGMASVRSNYIISCLERKLDWDQYYKCWTLLNNRGLDLLEKMPI